MTAAAHPTQILPLRFSSAERALASLLALRRMIQGSQITVSGRMPYNATSLQSGLPVCLASVRSTPRGSSQGSAIRTSQPILPPLQRTPSSPVPL